MKKIILVLIFCLVFIGQASAGNVSIVGKTLYLNGTATFPTIMYNLCSRSDTYSQPVTDCTIANLTNFTIDFVDFNYPPDESWYNLLTNYSASDTWWTVRNTDQNNVNFNTTIARQNNNRFFGYMQKDEPSGTSPYTTQNMTDRYNTTKLNDSNHPIITNHYRCFQDWESSGDAISMDRYEHFVNSTNENYPKNVNHSVLSYDLYMSAAFYNKASGCTLPSKYPNQSSKPVYHILQAYGNTTLVPGKTDENFTNMEENEIRATVFTALTADINGIGFYVFRGQASINYDLARNLTMFARYQKIAGEIRNMNDILLLDTDAFSWYGQKDNTSVSLSPNPTTSIEGLSVNNLGYILKNDSVNNKKYLLMVNKHNESSALTTINITSLAGTGTRTATLLAGGSSGSGDAGRTVNVVNGVFTDTFDAYAVHVYEIGAGIEFISPTPANNTGNTTGSIFVNTSYSTTSANLTGYFNWNKTIQAIYRFNNDSGYDNTTNIYDWSGNGRNCTWQSSTNQYTNGKFGNGLFGQNSTTSYLSCPSFNMSPPYSIEFWTKSNDSSNSNFIGKVAAGGTIDYFFRYSAGNGTLFQIYNGSGTVKSNYHIKNISDDTWHHVVLQRNDTAIWQVIDKVYNTPTTIPSGYSTLNSAIIKLFGASDGYRYKGAGDESRFINRIISSDEINASYNASANRLFNNFTGLNNGSSHNVTAYLQDGSGNVQSTEYREWTVDTTVYIPPAPVWVSNTTGTSWVNHTWQAGAGGNITDSYNINLNGVWTNGTTNTSVNTTIAPGGWSNITVWAFNNSGGLSLTNISNNSQVPAAPTPSASSSYLTSTCQSTLGWGEVGSALIIVLVLLSAGVVAFGFISGTLKMDTFQILEFVLGLVAVVVIGGIGVALINPIIIVVGCP